MAVRGSDFVDYVQSLNALLIFAFAACNEIGSKLHNRISFYASKEENEFLVGIFNRLI